jgi:hypothetical protein
VRIIATHSSELQQFLNEDETEYVDKRGKAGNFMTSLLTFDFVCFLSFWAQVLPQNKHHPKATPIAKNESLKGNRRSRFFAPKPHRRTKRNI